MGLLIDTSLWIAIERGKLSAADIHAITKQAPVFLSPVNIAEIRFGIELMTDAKRKQRATATFRRMRRKPLLRITAETAEVLGILAARLIQSVAAMTSASKTSGSLPKLYSRSSRYSRPTPKTFRTSRI